MLNGWWNNKRVKLCKSLSFETYQLFNKGIHSRTSFYQHHHTSWLFQRGYHLLHWLCTYNLCSWDKRRLSWLHFFSYLCQLLSLETVVTFSNINNVFGKDWSFYYEFVYKACSVGRSILWFPSMKLNFSLSESEGWRNSDKLSWGDFWQGLRIPDNTRGERRKKILIS